MKNKAHQTVSPLGFKENSDYKSITPVEYVYEQLDRYTVSLKCETKPLPPASLRCGKSLYMKTWKLES